MIEDCKSEKDCMDLYKTIKKEYDAYPDIAQKLRERRNGYNEASKKTPAPAPVPVPNPTSAPAPAPMPAPAPVAQQATPPVVEQPKKEEVKSELTEEIVAKKKQEIIDACNKAEYSDDVKKIYSLNRNFIDMHGLKEQLTAIGKTKKKKAL